MAISGAGQQKSFSNLQTEFGGSHPITMGEYASFRVSGSGNTIDMDDFAGAVALSWSNPAVDLNLPNNALVSTGSTSSGQANGIAIIGAAFQPADNRVRFRYGKGSNSVAVTFNYLNLSYTGVDPDQVEMQMNWTAVTSGTGTFTNGSGATSGAWNQLAKQTTSSDSGTFNGYIWSAQKSSSQGYGTAALDAGALASGSVALTFAFRGLDSSGNVIATSSTSNLETIYVAGTRSFGGGGGGFGGGGFEP